MKGKKGKIAIFYEFMLGPRIFAHAHEFDSFMAKFFHYHGMKVDRIPIKNPNKKDHWAIMEISKDKDRLTLQIDESLRKFEENRK